MSGRPFIDYIFKKNPASFCKRVEHSDVLVSMVQNHVS